MAYVFDPERLHEIAKEAVGLAPAEIFGKVASTLGRAYPRHVATDEAWVFNNAGGAMGQMSILHASLSEYIIVFGTPIGTEGHSGRYRTEVWDFMIAGEMWCYHEGEMERAVYGPGEAAHLGHKKAKGYRIPDHAWMLEYGRGPIPTMLAFGMADTVFSTLDLRTFVRSLGRYAKLTIKELLQGKI
jgi:hypothetical protein